MSIACCNTFVGSCRDVSVALGVYRSSMCWGAIQSNHLSCPAVHVDVLDCLADFCCTYTNKFQRIAAKVGMHDLPCSRPSSLTSVFAHRSVDSSRSVMHLQLYDEQPGSCLEAVILEYEQSHISKHSPTASNEFYDTVRHIAAWRHVKSCQLQSIGTAASAAQK